MGYQLPSIPSWSEKNIGYKDISNFEKISNQLFYMAYNTRVTHCFRIIYGLFGEIIENGKLDKKMESNFVSKNYKIHHILCE